MKTNSTSITAICVSLIGAASLSAQNAPTNDPVELTEEAGGQLVVKQLVPGKKIVIGQTPIEVLERHSKVEAKHQADAAAKSGESKIQPVKADPKALEAWLEQQVGATKIDGAKLVRLGNGVLFKTGTATLSDSGKITLDRVSRLIRNHESPRVKISVNAAPEVAKKRSVLLRDYFVKNSGAAASNVQIVSSIDGVTPKSARFATNILIMGKPKS